MARLPTIQREQLAPEQQPFYDAIAQSRGTISGPFTVLLNSPDLAARVAGVGAYIRFEAMLPLKVRTLAAIFTARELDCQYEWAAWVPQAQAAGVRDEIIAAVRDRRPPRDTTEEESQVLDFCHQALRGNHHVSEATYQAVVARFGVQGAVELAATIGYFAMIAMPLNAFEVDPNPAVPRLII